jgi:hypothetical protein
VLGQEAPDPGDVADGAVGEDQVGARVALGEIERVLPERRNAATGVEAALGFGASAGVGVDPTGAEEAAVGVRCGGKLRRWRRRSHRARASGR